MKVIEKHLNPKREIKEGVMVRWPEYPDRLYIVQKTNVSCCGHNDYCKITSIGRKHSALVPINDLVWDDVDYIEISK